MELVDKGDAQLGFRASGKVRDDIMGFLKSWWYANAPAAVPFSAASAMRAILFGLASGTYHIRKTDRRDE